MQVWFWRSIIGFARIQNPYIGVANFSAELSSGASSLALIIGALKWCRKTRIPNEGKAVHAQVIKNGFFRDIFIANNLISMYDDFKFPEDAAKLFDEMPERNTVSWTALISSYNRAGNPSEALRTFGEMLDAGIEEPNIHTFSAALKACAMLKDLGMGKWVHREIQSVQLQPDTVLMNVIIDMYVKCDSLVEAREVFDTVTPLNCVSWNTMILGYCNEGKMSEAENLFLEIPTPDVFSFNTIINGFSRIDNAKALYYVRIMHKECFKLDHYTLSGALRTCGSLGVSEMGEQVHSYIIRCGYDGSLYTGPSLVHMYGNCGQVHLAMKLFEDYSSGKWSGPGRLLLLNSMLSVFASNGYNKHALRLISKIHSTVVMFDAFTLSSTLKICINMNAVRIGLQVHGLITTTGHHVDVVVGSVLVYQYAKLGSLEDALKIFSGLPKKDLISWTCLITSCVERGSNRLAFSLFREMMSLNCEVDHFVVSIISKACAAISWLQGGEQLHALCMKGGFEMESATLTSLIDLYSKCGGIEDALKLFCNAPEKDSICWTGIIAGCGNNGRTDEAIRLFHKMLNSKGEQPNEITFLGILSACNHAGLVREATSFFEAMQQKLGLQPSLEHYCCMVDILSRAGLFEEALQLISSMPCKAEEMIWNSMLGSAMIHQNIDIGKLALLHLHLICREQASGYVSLSKVYASLNQWEGSAKMREFAFGVNMKEPGKSWTELRN